MTISNATIQSTSQINAFDLKDLLDSYKDTTSISINCHHVGTVQSFDASTQTATAKINYSKTYFQYNPATNSNVPVLIDYPVLMKCPVVLLGGGSASLTFPISTGDECLILFNDRSLDNWFQNGAGGAVNSPRTHSISDGIILVGLRSAQKVLSSVSSTHAVLQNGNTQVGVGPSTINISNGTSLGTLLKNLITAIEAITVTCASPGNPSGPPLNAAALAAISTQIGALLE